MKLDPGLWLDTPQGGDTAQLSLQIVARFGQRQNQGKTIHQVGS